MLTLSNTPLLLLLKDHHTQQAKLSFHFLSFPILVYIINPSCKENNWLKGLKTSSDVISFSSSSFNLSLKCSSHLCRNITPVQMCQCLAPPLGFFLSRRLTQPLTCLFSWLTARRWRQVHRYRGWRLWNQWTRYKWNRNKGSHGKQRAALLFATETCRAPPQLPSGGARCTCQPVCPWVDLQICIIAEGKISSEGYSSLFTLWSILPHIKKYLV